MTQKQKDMPPSDPSSADWQIRYRRTVSALLSARAMRPAIRHIQRIQGSDQPVLNIITGQRALRNRGRVVAFPGSFNPLTTAHIGLVNSVLATGFDAALWLLPVASVNKESVERAALPDRVAQMRSYVLTTQDQGLAIVNRGLYYEQARLLRERFPSGEISILVGFDKVEQIFDARYYDDRDAALDALFTHARLLVAPRAGAGRADLTALLARAENARFASRVAFLAAPPELADESSTQARTLAATAADMTIALRSLIPPEAMALVGTGAYETSFGTDAQLDRYQRRLTWLEDLAQG